MCERMVTLHASLHWLLARTDGNFAVSPTCSLSPFLRYTTIRGSRAVCSQTQVRPVLTKGVFTAFYTRLKPYSRTCCAVYPRSFKRRFAPLSRYEKSKRTLLNCRSAGLVPPDIWGLNCPQIPGPWSQSPSCTLGPFT